MLLKEMRNLLKTFGDDTRLRIINLLNHETLSVSDICSILKKNQPNISKHLTKMRLTGVVHDKREGFNVYYELNNNGDKIYESVIGNLVNNFKNIEILQKDIKKMQNFLKAD